MSNLDTITLFVFALLIGYGIYGAFRPEIRAFFGDPTLKNLLKKRKRGGER